MSISADPNPIAVNDSRALESSGRATQDPIIKGQELSNAQKLAAADKNTGKIEVNEQFRAQME